MGECDLQAQCPPLKRGRPDLPVTYKAESFRSEYLECHFHGGRVLNGNDIGQRRVALEWRDKREPR